jgi:hypothetical protein
MAAAVVKPRNRTAAVALILALLAWLAAALAIGLVVAGHAKTNGCIGDTLRGVESLRLFVGGLLSVGAGVTGLISLLKPRARGAYLAMGMAAMVMGAVVVALCFLWFRTWISPHADSPVYPHPWGALMARLRHRRRTRTPRRPRHRTQPAGALLSGAQAGHDLVEAEGDWLFELRVGA